jgi:Protein of unknown function (DUF2961)
MLAGIEGAGSINHVWMTVAPAADTVVPNDYVRHLVLRATWDGAATPSILTPLGDFFGVGHGRTTNFVAAPLQMSPDGGRGLNSWWHMPFADGARLEVSNELAGDVLLYFYVDYESFDALEDGLGRFHAHWRGEWTRGVDEGGLTNHEFQQTGTNLDGAGNYTILDTEGHGHYVGCVLNVVNGRTTSAHNWYGEGDDMIFIDGEAFPPTLHGTGTEDYFNSAWCPTDTFHAPYHGITLPGGPNWQGEISLYRFHVEDPIPFERSIRVTIEHGHANRRSDHLSSVAYWYQAEPSGRLTLPPISERLDRS